jgi:hypothetical protein
MSATGGKFPYVVVLKNTSARAFNILGILLNVASCLFFVNEFIIRGELNFYLLTGLSVVIGILIWNYYHNRHGRKVFYDRAYLVTGLLWLKMPYMQWMILPYVVLALLEHQVKFPVEIGFSENAIVVNSIFRKKYKWSQLSNVVLKDGLLTMDFWNNRLLQREVEDDEDEDDASEEEFNLFCREQLKKSLVAPYGKVSELHPPV